MRSEPMSLAKPPKYSRGYRRIASPCGKRKVISTLENIPYWRSVPVRRHNKTKRLGPLRPQGTLFISEAKKFVET